MSDLSLFWYRYAAKKAGILKRDDRGALLLPLSVQQLISVFKITRHLEENITVTCVPLITVFVAYMKTEYDQLSMDVEDLRSSALQFWIELGTALYRLAHRADGPRNDVLINKYTPNTGAMRRWASYSKDPICLAHIGLYFQAHLVPLNRLVLSSSAVLPVFALIADRFLVKTGRALPDLLESYLADDRHTPHMYWDKRPKTASEVRAQIEGRKKGMPLRVAQRIALRRHTPLAVFDIVEGHGQVTKATIEHIQGQGRTLDDYLDWELGIRSATDLEWELVEVIESVVLPKEGAPLRDDFLDSRHQPLAVQRRVVFCGLYLEDKVIEDPSLFEPILDAFIKYKDRGAGRLYQVWIQDEDT